MANGPQPAAEKKDPVIAAILAFCFWGLSYIYLGNIRKAVIYTGAVIGLVIVLFILGVVLAAVSSGFGGLCVLPLWLLIWPVSWLAIIYDVYQIASGKKAVLPEF